MSLASDALPPGRRYPSVSRASEVLRGAGATG
jgi:hypothetical protein